MELAQSMIRLSRAHGIEIVETGFRLCEKLCEELLVKTEELDKTDNNLIFIKRDTLLSREAIEEKIQILRDACHTNNEDKVRDALHAVVPMYKTPEESNANEMKRHQ